MAAGVLRVHRPYRQLTLTPEQAHDRGWRVEVRCSRCSAPRRLAIEATGPLRRWWSGDWETIYKEVGFRCATCRSPASGLRITRRTRERNETLLLIEQNAYHG